MIIQHQQTKKYDDSKTHFFSMTNRYYPFTIYHTMAEDSDDDLDHMEYSYDFVIRVPEMEDDHPS